jgi:hypothetical protein
MKKDGNQMKGLCQNQAQSFCINDRTDFSEEKVIDVNKLNFKN